MCVPARAAAAFARCPCFPDLPLPNRLVPPPSCTFVPQVPTGLEIVAKVFEFTSWP